MDLFLLLISTKNGKWLIIPRTCFGTHLLHNCCRYSDYPFLVEVGIKEWAYFVSPEKKNSKHAISSVWSRNLCWGRRDRSAPIWHGIFRLVPNLLETRRDRLIFLGSWSCLVKVQIESFCKLHWYELHWNIQRAVRQSGEVAGNPAPSSRGLCSRGNDVE